jgi:hypothetical protein
MSDEQKSGKNYNVKIGGDVSGQIAVGDDITQIHSSPSAPQQVTEADLAAVRQMFEELKAQIEAHAPPEKKEEALQQVQELHEAVNGEQPDLDRMSGVKSWFKRNIPKLAGTVVAVIVNPIVGKVVEAAGEGLASEIERRFGSHE